VLTIKTVIMRGVSKLSLIVLALTVLETVPPGGLVGRILLGTWDIEAMALQTDTDAQSTVVSAKIVQSGACLISSKESNQSAFTQLHRFLANGFCFIHDAQFLAALKLRLEQYSYVLDNDLQFNIALFIFHQPSRKLPPEVDPLYFS